MALPRVSLREAATSAPADWLGVIARLLAVGEDAGVEPCVFGALLWQHATGLEYLTGRSDLDLLWHMSGEAAAERLVQALTRLADAGSVRIDGEVVLPDGTGLHWRELAQAGSPAAMVLVKRMDGVRALPRAGLFRRLAAA